jgi:hypothetical protein
MQKKILSLAVASVLGGVAASANAALSVVEDGVGHILMVPYFSVQNGNSTLINIVNTDQTTGKAVKVRFRSALDSDDIFDFHIYLSPADMWTGEVSLNAVTGLAKMSTSDKSCTRPASVNQDFVTARLPGDSTEKANRTREGYVEIFTMADIENDGTDASSTATQQANSVYYQTKHVNGVAPCDAVVLAKIGTTPALMADLTQPSSGLMGNWTLINVPQAAAYGGGATALLSSGATTRRVYWDQNPLHPALVKDAVVAGVGGAVTIADTYLGADADITNVTTNTAPTGYTADGVLLSDADAAGAVFGTANYDFPDLSTPYETNNPSASFQADDLSNALLAAGLTNEYLTLGAIGEKTDWVISMPTRRYHVAGRGTTSDGVSSSTTGFYNPIDKAGPTGPFRNVTAQSLVEYSADGRTACVKIGGYTYYNREEGMPGAISVGDVISPNEPSATPAVRLCGEVTVVSINNAGTSSGVLGGNVALTSLTLEAGYEEGWARLSLNNGAADWAGLPAIGQAFVTATHPGVQPGVSGGFGGNWKHRVDVPAVTGSASVVQNPPER